MKVLILAAGYGTRLYPYTKDFPKPLLKIGRQPLINHLLHKIRELDNVSRIIVITNGKFFERFKAWKNTLRTKYPIRIINDLTMSPQERLGAIGDIHFAFSKEGFAGDFLVLGGDNLIEGDLVDFLKFARSKHPFTSIGLFDIKDKRQAKHYGVAILNREKRVIGLEEKPQSPKSSLVAMCLYYFTRQKLRLIEEYLSNPFNTSDTAGDYIKWLSKRDKVYGYKFSDFWADIGHMHTYKKVKGILKDRR